VDSEALEVEAGDIIGVCIFDPPDANGRETVQLDLVGMGKNDSQYLMATDCGESTLPDSISSQSLNEIPSLVLHFTADIGRIFFSDMNKCN